MKLENAKDLNTFLDFFKQYGDDLVELARLSGDRQNVYCFLLFLFYFLPMISKKIFIRI